MIAVAAGILVLIGIMAFFMFWLMKNQSSAWLKQDIEALRADFRNSVDQLISQVNERLKDNTSVLGERLDNAAKVVGSVREHLGRLNEASTRIFEVGKDISSLQDLLRAPKLRGGLGEFLLESLLSQVMPTKEFYQMQYAFKNGQVVDAVIKFREGVIPIDSKFPLENFKLMVAAQSEDEKRAVRRQFISDVKTHISSIAGKYILPDEGTFGFALMYIPAENVYYETIIKDEKFGDDGSLFQYSLHKKVIPVSPNTFYAYLQVILLGLRGMAIEKRTQEIIAGLGSLKGGFDKSYDDFAKLGRHLKDAGKSFEETDKRMVKLHEKILQIGDAQEPKAVAYGPKKAA